MESQTYLSSCLSVLLLTSRLDLIFQKACSLTKTILKVECVDMWECVHERERSKESQAVDKLAWMKLEDLLCYSRHVKCLAP